ncbi:type II toxin-antitoxin system RelB/DinJ family antitoxin [Mannheimia haemolytica]|uniref:type II toxin-antitoxin system RelB/DinJ family antitoxin n=1 Tax=Mannheimia haemolytica TaxID=75985 RepID=UPI00201B9B35|nr:type II toxin-antitoxin system RelB/DinJ family antitoxin [Mannheimia haemolytica]UQX68841.1 type II toxin-antitoxin system RelB/DinJ family antitoxin [Mannheimia haemolytica]
MAITDASISFRTVERTKAEAYQVIEQYGLTPSQVFNMFLNQIAKTRSIPVDLNYLRPNKDTLSAMDELDNGSAASFFIEAGENYSTEEFTKRILNGGQ